jgi:glycosyltransferase involved in cell wall biosynthesis
VENVEQYLWQSDVYVHTATYEPLGLVLLEAMAAGFPVISLDGGGNRDLMINGKNGFLIEKQDPKEFADRILEVYQNNEISNFNAEFAKQFDIKTYCDKLLEIYQS